MTRAVLAVEAERSRKTFFEANARSPAEVPLDLSEVGVEVADVDRLTLRRERNELELSALVHLHEERGEVEQADNLVVAEVVDLTPRLVARRREEESRDHIVDVVEIPSLRA